MVSVIKLISRSHLELLLVTLELMSTKADLTVRGAQSPIRLCPSWGAVGLTEASRSYRHGVPCAERLNSLGAPDLQTMTADHQPDMGRRLAACSVSSRESLEK